MKPFIYTIAALLLGTSAAAVATGDNRISADLADVDVIHNGKIVTIGRANDNSDMPRGYDNIARHCPPFCIQPMQVLPGVETVGELELLGYLKRRSEGDDSVLVIDSRTPDWTSRGTIPGAVNVPWNRINTDVGGSFAIDSEAGSLEQIMHDQFGAVRTASGWDFSNAKLLVLFCNGAWCGQSSMNIRTLAKLGYPTHKLKWYRGGMQEWVSLGLSIARP